MPIGPCPECKNPVALSAKKCPQCGNRDFAVDSGFTSEASCFNCCGTKSVPINRGSGKSAFISHEECSSCKGTGKLIKRYSYDVRNPDGMKLVAAERDKFNAEEPGRMRAARSSYDDKLKAVEWHKEYEKTKSY